MLHRHLPLRTNQHSPQHRLPRPRQQPLRPEIEKHLQILPATPTCHCEEAFLGRRGNLNLSITLFDPHPNTQQSPAISGTVDLFDGWQRSAKQTDGDLLAR